MTIQFQDGFETNVLIPPWDRVLGDSPTIVTRWAQEGTYSMEAVLKAGSGGGHVSVLKSFTPLLEGEARHARAYIQFDRITHTGGNLHFIWFGQEGVGGIATCGIWMDGNTPKWRIWARHGGQWTRFDTNVIAELNRVYCVELRMVWSAGAGEYILYIDDVPIQTVTAVNNADRTPNCVAFGMIDSTRKEVDITMLGDAFVLADTYIGTAPPPPPVPSLTLSVDKSSVRTDEPYTFTAKLTVNGMPLEGQTVNLNLDTTMIGVMADIGGGLYQATHSQPVEGSYTYQAYAPIQAVSSNTVTVTVTAPPVEYTLTITATDGGTTSPAPGSYSIVEGTIVSVTAIPNAGYSFAYWELDGVNVGSANPYSVTMNKDHTLHAVFILSQATLSGVVKDAATLLPLEGVTVTLERTG